MGKKNSKRSSKKGKSKKSKAKRTESILAKEQQQQKSSFEDLSEILWGANAEQGTASNVNINENITQANAAENITETTSTDVGNDEIKAKQQELLSNLKNLNEAIAAITLTRDNTASLRVEVLSNIYFTRQIRPLIDAVNLIAFASSNMANVANNININSFGDKKEIKNSFKLCYKMNDEIDDMLNALSRRIKLYVAQLDNMDKNCPPFSFDDDEDS